MNWDKIILETYRELYSNSTPKADFDKLVKDAKINNRGEKEIPFLDYEIDRDIYDKIIDYKIKGYKIKGYNVRRFKTNIALGCSPKIKI